MIAYDRSSDDESRNDDLTPTFDDPLFVALNSK